jgi:ATP-dependent Clp protease ATP-binding subunit ClpA
MFERYTEKARRVIFFARYEASQYGSPSIESEHLLLGLMREDKAIPRSHIESIRKEIESHIRIRERISTSVEVPLSQECNGILNYAAEEAERLGDKHGRHGTSTPGNPARRSMLSCSHTPRSPSSYAGERMVLRGFSSAVLSARQTRRWPRNYLCI